MSQPSQLPELSARPTRRPFASPGLIRTLAGTVMAAGVLASFWGVAYDINGATQAQGDVVVAVHLMRPWGSTVPEQLLGRGGLAVVGLCLGLDGPSSPVYARICLVIGCSPGDVFSLAPPAG